MYDRMNTKDLTSNRKLLAMMIGVALCAAVGLSLAYAQTTTTTDTTAGTTQGQSSQGNAPPQIQGSVNLPQQLLASVHVKFTDAANTAASNVPNGQVIGGSLTVMQGYVVYNFKVIDGKNIYSVIVDAGDGKLLYTSQGHPIQIDSLFGMEHPGMMHKSHMGAGAWKSHGSSTPTSPSSGTQ